MNRTLRSVLFSSGIFLALVGMHGLTCVAQVPVGDTTCYVEESNGRRHQVDCPKGGQTGNTPTPIDNGAAERLAKEKADKEKADREAEEKRIADEAKAKKEAADRQKAFEKSRDETLQTLKGSGGNTGIRGSSTDDTGIRGSSPSTGIRDGVSVAPVPVPVDDGLTLPFRQAIEDAFPNSKPEVTERIRKGFQAIDTPDHQDWKVAKAWFQDALNREPGNVGIMRLVALCDYTMTKPAPPPAKLPEPPKTKTYAELEAWRQDFMARQEKISLEQFQRAQNEFYLNYVPKHPELKLKVIIKPAPPAGKKPEMTLELFRRQLQDFLGIPRPKHVTAVAAVRG